MDTASIRFVIAAYALTWVCLGAYAFYVHRVLRRARDEHARVTGAPAGEAR